MYRFHGAPSYIYCLESGGGCSGGDWGGGWGSNARASGGHCTEVPQGIPGCVNWQVVLTVLALMVVSIEWKAWGVRFSSACLANLLISTQVCTQQA